MVKRRRNNNAFVSVLGAYCTETIKPMASCFILTYMRGCCLKTKHKLQVDIVHT